MPKDRTKWRADRGSRALKRIAEIETSITVLTDDDLLDLADIFSGGDSAIGEIAALEMAKRNISLG